LDEAERRAPIDVLVKMRIAHETLVFGYFMEEWRRRLGRQFNGHVRRRPGRCPAAWRRAAAAPSSYGSKNAIDGEAGYRITNASKGGVVMLTKTMALELANSGIRVTPCAGLFANPDVGGHRQPGFRSGFVDR